MNMRVKLGILALAIFWLAIVAASWAEAEADAAETSQAIDRAPAASPPTASDDDEYSFNWLDPDKKIYVLQNRRFLQNRRYLKANHAELSLLVGPGLSNSYRNVFNVEPRIAYFFSEAWGIEGFYTNSFNQPNATVDALRRATNTTLAVVREIHSEVGAVIDYVPWYAKINVFNKILYFDWYLAAGVGSISSVLTDSSTTGKVYLSQNSPGFVLSTGHQFHLSDTLLFRLDMTGTFYNAQIDTTNGDKTWYSNFNFGVGIGLKL
jgi:outer membrane beta-barrel protein